MKIYLLTMNGAHLNKAFESEDVVLNEIKKRQELVDAAEEHFIFDYEVIELIKED